MSIGEAEQLLNRGLAAGYAGQSASDLVERGPFVGEQSVYREGLDALYIDQWFAGRSGGGQELVVVEGKKQTRVYSGGDVTTEYLEKAGVTEEEVSRMHKKFLERAKGKTRLDQEHWDELVEANKRWAYEYRVLHHIKEIPQTIGIEMIHVDSHIVFSHGFVRAPVE